MYVLAVTRISLKLELASGLDLQFIVLLSKPTRSTSESAHPNDFFQSIEVEAWRLQIREHRKSLSMLSMPVQVAFHHLNHNVAREK